MEEETEEEEEEVGENGVYEDSLENLTKQRIDLVMEQLAGDRSNQKSGGSSYRGMRPVGSSTGSARARLGRGRRTIAGGEIGEENLAGYPRGEGIQDSRGSKKIEKESIR